MGRPTILVVDDNAATRALIQDTLELEGYRVIGLADGSSVAATLEQHPAELVILDVMMPRVDGFAALGTIRSNERIRHTPVLMLTALDDGDSTWKGWTGGCDYYMNKPFDIEDLLAVVRNLTQGAYA